MTEQTYRLYCIKIGTQLDPSWQEWFEGMQLSFNTDGTTSLIGILDDQAQLHTILNKIRNLNIDLISVICDDVQTN